VISSGGQGRLGLRVLLLGVGRQGRAALLDLAASDTVAEVVAADLDHDGLVAFVFDQGLDHRVRCVRADACDAGLIDSLVGSGVDVVVDLLPVALHDVVSEAAVCHRAHLVNASYVSPGLRGLGDLARERDLTLLPELGLDPGIDLVLLGEAVRGLDRVQSIRSYAAGFPELGSEDNPLRYKVTWTLEGVLRSYRRAATVIRSGSGVHIPDTEILSTENVHEVDVEGVGRLEAFPNGDGLEYLDLRGLG